MKFSITDSYKNLEYVQWFIQYKLKMYMVDKHAECENVIAAVLEVVRFSY